jgi:hypothetical protein
MLGIYGGHLILMETPVDLALFREVVRNLRMLLLGHPDVEALALRAVGEPLPPPFDHAPMLRRSWSLIVDASVTQPWLVTDSLGARSTLEASDGPWHIWRAEPDTVAKGATLGDALDLSDIELALAEDLGVMKRVRRRRERLASRSDSATDDSPISKGAVSQTLETDTADATVQIGPERMRSIATRFGMPSTQLKRTLQALEHKLTSSQEAPNVRFLMT